MENKEDIIKKVLSSEKITLEKYTFKCDTVTTPKGEALHIYLTGSDVRFPIETTLNNTKIADLVTNDIILYRGKVRIKVDEGFISREIKSDVKVGNPRENPLIMWQEDGNTDIGFVGIGFTKDGLSIEPREHGVLAQSSGFWIKGIHGKHILIYLGGRMVMETHNASSIAPERGQFIILTDPSKGQCLIVEA